MSPSSSRGSPLPGLLAALLGLAALVQFSVLAFLVARPLVTDDLWWSLSLGEAFLDRGPWLADDPLLFDALGAPDPAAWLFDVLLYAVGASAGFQGLRALHVGLVAIALLAGWRLLRGAGLDRSLAILALQIFVALAAFRLCQLRAQLISIVFVFVFVDALVRNRERSLAWTAGLALAQAVWANSHAGFVLGPYLVGLATLASAFGARETRGAGEIRTSTESAQRLRLLGAVLLASLVNPLGIRAYTRLFSPGGETPDLTFIADEWTAFQPFVLPSGGLPPSPLTWLLSWAIGVGLMVATVRLLTRRRRNESPWPTARPLTLLLLAWGVLPLALGAIRFLWLGSISVLPVLVSSLHARPASQATDRRSWANAALAILLSVGFVRAGAWPILAPGTPLTPAGYAEPYSPRKYHAHAVGFVADTGISGRAFTHYFLSGFLGFWSAPGLRTFINGSLNVPPERLRQYVELARAYPLGWQAEHRQRLDEHGIDLFLGTGLPIAQDPRTPWRDTTRQLEGSPDWQLVFRSARSSVYLRRQARNQSNLDRIAAYYARAGVPFDPEAGFDVERVLDRAPGWAFRHGLIPSDYPRLVAATAYGVSTDRLRAARRLSLVYAALGLYERSAALERGLLTETAGGNQEKGGDDLVALRRLAWSLARSHRRAELPDLLHRLERQDELDALGQQLRDALRAAIATGDFESLAALPLLARHEAPELTSGYRSPTAHTGFPPPRAVR